MALGVNIIHKTKNQSLNDNGKLYGVLIDDTISEIKNKIFANTDDFYKQTISFYPNLIKLEMNNIILKDETRNLSFYISDISDTYNIYVTSVFDIIINKEKYDNIDLDAYKLYTCLKNDDSIILELYEKLVEDFTELRQDDLEIIIKMKMFNFNKSLDVKIISSDENNLLMKDIKQFFTTIKSTFDIQNKKQKRDNEILKDFYDKVYSYNPEKYYDSTDQGFPNFVFTTINFKYKSKNYESGFAGKFIKLSQIFNLFELSDDIPLIAFNDSPRKDPKVKIYNKIINTLNENIIKSWFLNEKKKQNKAVYKKIKGLMFKCHLQDVKTTKLQNSYITVILNENGLITIRVNFDEDDDQRSMYLIDKSIRNTIDKLIERINLLYGVFTQSKRLQKTDEMKSSLTSVSSVLETNKKINKTKFKQILTKYEASRMFDAKDIKDIISMYYKRFGKRENEVESLDKLGITINIKDNPYKLDSSAIVIYGAYNLIQSKTIIDEIMILSEISNKIKKNIFEDDESEDEEVILKERKQNVKKVRELGGKTSSIICQKNRQPKIDNETKIQDPELVLVYKGNKYICDSTSKHIYPGLSGDIPCCFKYPGKGLENIVSSEILEIKVQPSNLLLQVQHQDTVFNTFVIKVTSESVENLDLSLSRYFYLNPGQTTGFPLIHIHQQDLIQKIDKDSVNEKGETIWLTEVPLYQLITKPKKNNCLHIPNINEATKEDINASCKHHDKEKIFGYNIKSYPSCFENPQPVYRVVKEDKNLSTKHIITTDKLLGHKRQGILQPGLNKLLNEFVTRKQGAFLRWGVNQNQLSFLNCIVESISNKSEFKIDNTYALKRLLINHLLQNPDDFIKLNSGNISLRYGNMQEYINKIEQDIHWTDIIDLVQIVLKCNILIIEIPYVETLSKTNFVYEDMRLVCNLNIKQDLNKPFLLLVKKQNSFELIVLNDAAIWNKTSEKIQISEKVQQKITFVFDYNSNQGPKDNIVNFFVDYYTKTCVKENELPDKYPYDELYLASYIIQQLKDKQEILLQLVNSFNKVNFIVTKRGLIIPIQETGIINKIPSVMLSDFISKNKAVDVQKLLDLIDDFNDLNIEPKMSILGFTVKDNIYTGALSNFGQIIPVKNTDIIQDINIPILKQKYYSDIDDILSNKKIVDNKEQIWNSDINNNNTIIYEIKKTIGEKIVNNDISKQKVVDIIKNSSIQKLQKIKMVKEIIEPLVSDKNIENLDFLLDNISNEIINDNIENSLLNNLITSEKFNPDEIIKRTTESVWLNLSDIKKWFKKLKQ